MKALIFNSGVGKRMGDLTKDKPKCMVDIGFGYTIVRWQLKVLECLGVQELIMTTGPFERRLRDHILELRCNLNIRFVNNPEYEKTNYIYSMYCASPYMDDDVLILHGDLLFEQSVLYELISCQRSTVIVDSLAPLTEKDFKAMICDGRVRSIGVDLFGENCVACQPAYKLLRSDVEIWLERVHSFCAEGKKNVYAENALNQCTNRLLLYPLELRNRLCNEIDDEQDLALVSKRFADIVQKGI